MTGRPVALFSVSDQSWKRETTMKIVALLASAAAVIAAPASAATVELVKNGNFSAVGGTNSSTTNFQFGDDPLATGTVTDWNMTSTAATRAAGNYAYNLLVNENRAQQNATGRYNYTGAEYLSSVPRGTAGHGNFVVLDGDSSVSGYLWQTINNLVVGQDYRLTFDWAAGQLASRTGATTDSVTYGFGSQIFSTPTVAVASGGSAPWQTVSQMFRATSTSQALGFLANGTPNGLPPVVLLDNVSLSAVPEPATWGLMLVGFGLVGAGMRTRRRSVAFAG